MTLLLYPDGRWLPAMPHQGFMAWAWLRYGLSLGPGQSIIRGHAGVWFEVGM